MSVEAMTIALHHSRATGTAKVVLLGIANHEGDGGAWPSIATLAKYANASERSVQRAITGLERLGEVQRANTGERDDALPARIPGHLRPNLYKFLLVCPPDCDRTTSHRTTAERSPAKARAKAPAAATTTPAKPSLDLPDDRTALTIANERVRRLSRPERCAEHQDNDVPPPCGACARARQVIEAAEAEREQRQRRAAAERLKAERDERARLLQAGIDACSNCDRTGRVGNGMPCDHEPNRAEVNSRGRAAVDAALAGARA